MRKIIDRIEKDIVHLANFRLDIARNRKIDHEHRAMAAQPDGALGHAQTNDRQRTGRTRNDDIELR